VSIKPLLYGTVTKGKLVFDYPAQLASHLQRLDGAVQITIEPKKKKRSTAENNYMWGVVIPILAEYFGYDNEEMHEALKMTFLKVHSDGKPDTVKSTAKLSTTEMEDYLSSIRIWASRDYGVFIPEPNEIEWQ